MDKMESLRPQETDKSNNELMIIKIKDKIFCDAWVPRNVQNKLFSNLT